MQALGAPWTCTTSSNTFQSNKQCLADKNGILHYIYIYIYINWVKFSTWTRQLKNKHQPFWRGEILLFQALGHSSSQSTENKRSLWLSSRYLEASKGPELELPLKYILWVCEIHKLYCIIVFAKQMQLAREAYNFTFNYVSKWILKLLKIIKVSDK